MYKFLLRPIFFLFDPEKVHQFTFAVLRVLFRIPVLNLIFRNNFRSSKLKTSLWGIDFENPIGLAAGFDKNAKMYDEFSAMGFGFIEIGTVTPKPQAGNAKRRLFRLKKDKALINRMGFNNDGMVVIRKRLLRNKKVIIGGNIGKNKTTPNSEAQLDYITCFKELYPVVDYFVVNVSSPNTPGLRELQNEEFLDTLLTLLKAESMKFEKQKPVLLKIAPDLSKKQVDSLVNIILKTKTDGIIISNTTIDKSDLKSSPAIISEAGGLSGVPLRNKSTEMIKYVSELTKGKLPIIGVGGIFSSKDAQEKLDAGASLIQLYTGFVYEGPKLVQRILKSLADARSN